MRANGLIISVPISIPPLQVTHNHSIREIDAIILNFCPVIYIHMAIIR